MLKLDPKLKLDTFDTQASLANTTHVCRGTDCFLNRENELLLLRSVFGKFGIAFSSKFVYLFNAIDRLALIAFDFTLLRRCAMSNKAILKRLLLVKKNVKLFILFFYFNKGESALIYFINRPTC